MRFSACCYVLKHPFSHFLTHFHSPFPLFSTQLPLDLRIFLFYLICILTDMQFWQVVCESSVRETGGMAVAEGHASVGSPNPRHIQTPRFFLLPSPHLPLCPCRPGTCVTYNWFINNVNRCFWSSLESCQLASILFYCHSLPDCIPINAHWHRMEEIDVYLILKRIEGEKWLHRLFLFYKLCMSMSARSMTHQQNNALSLHSRKMSVPLPVTLMGPSQDFYHGRYCIWDFFF